MTCRGKALPSKQMDKNHQTGGTLVLICGLPGSGKTTLAKQIEAERGAILMSPDDWIEAVLANPEDREERDRLRSAVENLQWKAARDYLAKGHTVILDNGFWSEMERTQYAMEALEIGARIELYAMDSSDRDELWRRIEKRNQELTSPVWIMQREDHDPHWTGFEPPTPHEISFYDDGGFRS